MCMNIGIELILFDMTVETVKKYFMSCYKQKFTSLHKTGTITAIMAHIIDRHFLSQ
jgi:hypothetical protein